jgi:hypothetical protein
MSFKPTNTNIKHGTDLSDAVQSSADGLILAHRIVYKYILTYNAFCQLLLINCKRAVPDGRNDHALDLLQGLLPALISPFLRV